MSRGLLGRLSRLASEARPRRRADLWATVYVESVADGDAHGPSSHVSSGDADRRAGDDGPRLSG